jgi:Zn-dependent alcohol dehydrogenase
VEEIGPGVSSVTPGDRVVVSWAIPCGRCRQCLLGRPRRCGHELAQPPRIHRSGSDEALIGVLFCGTLATHTVVTEPQVIRMPEGIPLSRACLLGCGVSTGVGAAIQTAECGRVPAWRSSASAASVCRRYRVRGSPARRG